MSCCNQTLQSKWFIKTRFVFWWFWRLWKLEVTMESGVGFFHMAEGRKAERATPPRISFITALSTILKVEPPCSNHLLKLSIPLKERCILFLVRYMCASHVWICARECRCLQRPEVFESLELGWL